MNSTCLKEITADQFLDTIVAPRANALVKISTTWSGTGQMLQHTLDELSQKYSDKIDFFFLNQEFNSEISIQYNVEILPTLLFFKKGTLVDKLPGLNHRSTIEEKLNQIVND